MSQLTDTVNDPATAPVVAALEAFLAAPNLFDTMVDYLANPNTPQAVRRVIGDLLVLGDRLGTQWAVSL